MIGNVNEEAQTILNNAKKEMIGLGHPYIGTEHLLLAILNSDSNICDRLSEYGLEYDNFKSELSSTPGEASIYDSKYTNLVNQDKLTHHRDEVLTMDIPEEPINELAVTFDKELDNSVKEDSSKVKEEQIEVNYTSPDLDNFIPEEQEEHKVLERKINNPWADSGARTVSPGELNF